jgi:hypothetical protein
MIVLNTCNNVKVQYTDSDPKKIFSIVVLNKSTAPELLLFDDILVDEKTAVFLREFPFEWLESHDKTQIYGVRVDADKQVCREFLRQHLTSNSEILLDHE